MELFNFILKHDPDVKQLKIFFEKHKLNDNLIDICQVNTNIEIIKFLIKEYKINPNQKNNYGDNCLELACRENTNIDIIKYLIEIHCMDPNQKDNDGENCLTLACWQNTNVDIEIHKMDP